MARLRLLVENAGRVVDRDTIMGAVWADVIVTDESITQCVRDIRKALGDEAQRMLRTVPKRGYLLAVEVMPAGAFRPTPGGERRPLVSVAALFAVLFLGGVWHFRPGEPLPREKPAIAVLPFNNLGGDEATGRLADGVAEDIITDLARFRELDVIARNSTFVYKSKTTDVRQVGKELNVDYVIEGSIQRQADRVRVTVQLVEADTGAHVWSERWDRPVADVFAVQSEVADAVAGRLGGHGVIAGAARSRPAQAAYRPYGLRPLPARDLAEAPPDQGEPSGGDPARAQAEIEKALALNPSGSMPLFEHASWASAFGEPAKGAEAADRLTRIDPNLRAVAPGGVSYAYFMVGRYEDALRELTTKPEESLLRMFAVIKAGALAMLDRGEEAKAVVARALGRFPDLTIESFVGRPEWADHERKRYVETMRKAGFPACASATEIARLTKPVRLLGNAALPRQGGRQGRVGGGGGVIPMDAVQAPAVWRFDGSTLDFGRGALPGRTGPRSSYGPSRRQGSVVRRASGQRVRRPLESSRPVVPSTARQASTSASLTGGRNRAQGRLPSSRRQPARLVSMRENGIKRRRSAGTAVRHAQLGPTAGRAR